MLQLLSYWDYLQLFSSIFATINLLVEPTGIVLPQKEGFWILKQYAYIYILKLHKKLFVPIINTFRTQVYKSEKNQMLKMKYT